MHPPSNLPPPPSSLSGDEFSGPNQKSHILPIWVPTFVPDTLSLKEPYSPSLRNIWTGDGLDLHHQNTMAPTSVASPYPTGSPRAISGSPQSSEKHSWSTATMPISQSPSSIVPLLGSKSALPHPMNSNSQQTASNYGQNDRQNSVNSGSADWSQLVIANARSLPPASGH